MVLESLKFEKDGSLILAEDRHGGEIEKGGKMRDYPETHQRGVISIENIPDKKHFQGDLGIQITKDGRIWMCIDGIAFVRFKPWREKNGDY